MLIENEDSIKYKLPSMEHYSFNTKETEDIYNLAGADLLSVSQLRTLVLLMSQKIIKDIK